MIRALYHSLYRKCIDVSAMLLSIIAKHIKTAIQLNGLICIAALFAGCQLTSNTNTLPDNPPLPTVILPTDVPTVQLTPAPTAQPLPPGFSDELAVMRGVCFESAYDAAEQVFILRDPAALNAFFDAADQSQLCRRAIKRENFDFSNGRGLAVLWTRGNGCQAWHNVLAQTRDDAAKTLVLSLQFVEQGDCPYELVRPFVVGIPAALDYDIRINITERIRQPLPDT